MTGNETNTKGNQMTNARMIASRNHEAALKTLRAAEMGTDLAAYEAANEAARITREALVIAERINPTKKEVARERNAVRLANMGWRVNK